MKKSGILNADISRVLAYMGHTDTIAVGDCGLPVPEETDVVFYGCAQSCVRRHED